LADFSIDEPAHPVSTFTSREFQQRLRKRLHRAGLAIDSETIEALERYYRLLSRWNEKINLTGLPLQTGSESTLDRLIVEPLLAARALPFPEALVVDVGSGGGSPAIPFRLAGARLSMVMIEAKTRKAVFLREVVRELNLPRTTVEAARAEELLPRPDLHEAADVVTVRAVRIERRLLHTLQAFLKPGGEVFLFRSASGPDVPAMAPPPLTWQRTLPIGDAGGARLTILSKVGTPTP
jgi:16S rRNA (guanine527-N7)-methyltransferase